MSRKVSFIVFCALAHFQAHAAPHVDFSLRDANGKTYTAADLRRDKATVLLFVATDCPNSNTYAPVLARLYREYAERGVLFLNVYSDPEETEATVKQHDAEYQVPFAALLDPHQTLARLTGAKSTPEAVILSSSGQTLYRGRVDDRFADIGKTRFNPSKDDLREALEAILQGKPVPVPVTRVIGCAIPGVN
jgi:thiol-disulfide isomerase/thioredoxin